MMPRAATVGCICHNPNNLGTPALRPLGLDRRPGYAANNKYFGGRGMNLCGEKR
jgi:hypothetical protein